jgi:diguanylate cyclase (GGDEF)-like protein/PAS domain S-box-containing protein
MAMPATPQPLRILVVEDSEDDAALLLRVLRRGGLDPVTRRVDTPEAMRAALRDETWDAITCDFVMPRFSGPDALKVLQQSGLDLPFVVISGKVGEETAVEMMKAGAHDFIVKGRLARLVPALRREVRDANMRRQARLAQALLAESEAHFHALARLSPVGIFQIDAEGKFLYANERWTEMTGMGPEEALGRAWKGAIHPEDRPRVAAEWYASVAEKRLFSLEYRLRRPDGKVTWVLGRAASEVSDSGANGSSLVGTVTDISQLKQAEWQLRERVKEQSSLYAVAELASWPQLSEAQLLQRSLPLICAAFQYPGSTGARILYNEALYATDNFGESRWALKSELKVGRAEGWIEVRYLQDCPEQDDGPFLDEERAFLDSVARTLRTSLAAKRDGQALRQSERDLREAQRVARVGSWAWDIPSDTVTWSEELYRISGRDSRLGAPSVASQRSLYAEDSWERLHAALNSSIASGAPFEVDLEVLRPDGNRWVVARGAAVSDPKGSVVRLHGTVLDITERKQAEQALQASQARFRALTEHGSDIVVVLDAQGRITYASPSLTAIGGYRVDEVVGRPFSGFTHPEDLSIASADFAWLVQHPGVPHAAELRYRHKTGSWIVLATISKNALGDPAVRGLVVNARDVTDRRQMEDRLRLSNAVVENSPVVLYRLAGAGRGDAVEYVSQNFRQFGYAAEDVVAGRVRYSDLIMGEDSARIAAEMARCIAGGFTECLLEYRLLTKAGEARWIEDHVRVQRDAAGAVVGLEGLLRDITERKRQEARIARLDRIRAVLSGINNVIVRVRDENELFQEACRIAVEKGLFRMAWIGVLDREETGIRVAAAAGSVDGFLERLASCGHLEVAAEPFESALKSGGRVVVNDIRTGGCASCRAEAASRGFQSYAMFPITVGEATAGLLALYSGERAAFDDEELQLLAEMAADVSFGWDHIGMDRKVAYLALYDPLTGLGNRTLFAERLQHQVNQAAGASARVALALLDIERFHNINDTLGWHAGDAVLKEVAARLVGLEGEGAVARINADSFALATFHGAVESATLQRFEEILKRCFGEPFLVNGSELRLAARCGIALFPNDASDADVLLKNAAVALKKTKESDERVLFYSPDMNARVAERIGLESRLHKALELGQFELHYQPKIDAKSAAVVGLEALIRWNDPQRGLVSPADFIPLLEETGLILPVGRWAIERAVRQFREWRSAGLAAPCIAVNVSAVQLRQKDFVPMVLGAVSACDDPGCLDLEITESLIMRDIQDNIRKLKALRAAGVRTAIDDFGTGYSSLAYLAKLPVDSLKIDRSFVISMPHSADDMGIVSALITLAHQLDLLVVAEGVEAEEQAKLLRLLKCDQLQGFLFGRPVPPVAIQARLGAAPATAR